MGTTIDRRRGDRREHARPDVNERRRPRAAFSGSQLVWVTDRLPFWGAHTSGWNERRCASCRDEVLVWDGARREAPPAFFCPDCLDRAAPPDAYDELGGSG